MRWVLGVMRRKSFSGWTLSPNSLVAEMLRSYNPPRFAEPVRANGFARLLASDN
jgi:hypothetical protein